MFSVHQKVNLYLQHFSEICKTQATLINGVCALYDNNNNEAVIIEVPDQSDSAFLHATLVALPQANTELTMNRLLALNFEAAAMKGTWIALNDKQDICLCATIQLNQTNEQHFSHSIIGFIEHSKELRNFIIQMIDTQFKKPN